MCVWSCACVWGCGPVGDFCPPGTGVLGPINFCASPTAYCPLGSAIPTPTDVGYYTVPTTPTSGLYYNETLCELGWYCIAGVRQQCAAGRYGASTAMTTADCTGVCEAGYYCPSGSTSPEQGPCGSPAAYCPQVLDVPCG